MRGFGIYRCVYKDSDGPTSYEADPYLWNRTSEKDRDQLYTSG